MEALIVQMFVLALPDGTITSGPWFQQHTAEAVRRQQHPSTVVVRIAIKGQKVLP